MWKLFIWPCIYWLLHVINQYTSKGGTDYSGFISNSFGYAVFEIFIILTWISYIFITCLYLFMQKKRKELVIGTDVLLLGIVSSLFGFFMWGVSVVTGVSFALDVADVIFQSTVWQFPYFVLPPLGKMLRYVPNCYSHVELVDLLT